MLERGINLPNANFEKANPDINLSEMNLKVRWKIHFPFNFLCLSSVELHAECTELVN